MDIYCVILVDWPHYIWNENFLYLNFVNNQTNILLLQSYRIFILFYFKKKNYMILPKKELASDLV